MKEVMSFVGNNIYQTIYIVGRDLDKLPNKS